MIMEITIVQQGMNMEKVKQKLHFLVVLVDIQL